MVDSRAKGARGEYLVRDLLRDHTNLQFERVPMSGALEYLKGDLYVPNEKNFFCIEVKNYAESPLSDKILSQVKTNNLLRWWRKLVTQALAGKQRPLLFFKYNRSKIYVGTETKPESTRYIYISDINCYICIADQWLEKEEVEFINGS